MQMDRGLTHIRPRSFIQKTAVRLQLDHGVLKVSQSRCGIGS